MAAPAFTARWWRQRSYWVRLGDALGSKLLWFIVAALEAVLTLFSQLPEDVRKPALDIAAGVVSSSAMLVVFWCGWVLLLRRLSGLARVAAAVPIIMLAAAARGIVLQMLLVSWNMSAAGIEGYRYRIVAGISLVLMECFTIAVVKVAVEAHRDRLEQLDSEQERLAQILATTEAGIQADQSGAIASISAYLSGQLAEVRELAPSFAITSLEQLAGSVVRPLSHDLAAATPAWQAPQPAVVQRRLSWSGVAGTMVSIGFIDPWGPAILLLLVTPASIAATGFASAIVLHVVAAGLVFVGLWTLRRAAPGLGARRSIPVRLALTTALLVVACTPAALATRLVAGQTASHANVGIVLIVVPVAALLLAFVRATRLQQREIDEAVSGIVEDTRWWVSRARMVRWWQTGTLARALHGPVQSAIHAAVERLRTAVDGATATPDLVESVLDDVRHTLPDVVTRANETGDVAADLAVLAAMWEPALVVDYSLDEDVIELINADIVCAEIAVDVVGEAVSNAAHHGRAGRIHISLVAASDRTISIQVSDDGSGWEAAADGAAVREGLGSAQLDTCALSWESSDAPGANVLRVDLPLLPPGQPEQLLSA